MSLRLVLLEEIPEDEHLHREWNALVRQMERPEVFYTYEWARAVQSSYHRILKPWLFLAYENDSLAGIVSLGSNVGSGTVAFLAANTADYCDFISAPASRAEFVDLVFAELAKRRIGKLVLANLPVDSETPKAIQVAAAKQGLYAFQRPAYSCTQVILGVGEEREKLKASLQKKLNRRLRGLERRGTPKYMHLQSWASIQPALQNFFDAHAARFQATGRVSSLATAERRNFLEDMARRFSDSGTVTLSILMVNDQTIAWNYGFQFGAGWFWYQPTFDGRWEEHSPGYCLLARIVIEACENKEMKVVDLGLGDEAYKDRFGNGVRETLHVAVTKSRLKHLGEIARYKVASSLKQSPKIERTIRRFIGR
ncbi:MAG: GNAT family N-acetyltransferase [Candidatus Sulfotelmatobacter sp.]